MADKKFTLTFDVEGNLSPIKGAVKDFQSTIKSAKFQIPVGIQGNIDKTISKLNAEIAEFESLTSQGFSNMADIGKAEKSFAKITSLMRQLGSQGEQIKGLDPKKFLPKEILDRTAKLEKAFSKLGDIKINTKKIDAQTEAVEKQKKEVEELKTKYEALAAENKTSGARKGNLSSSIKSKEKELEVIQKQMEALEKVKGGKSSAEYSKLNSEFKTLSKTISAQKAEFASLDTSINKNKTTMSGLKVQLDSASSSLEQMEESLKQLQASANVNEDLENLRKELAQLKNVNIDEIPSDLDEIKRIIGSLDDEQIKTIKNSLEGMGKAADELVPSLEKTSKELEKTGQEGKELTRVGQEIENLKGQVLDFFSITNTIQIFKNAVRDAFDTVKELDAVMTETAVVTDFSIGDMWDKLPEYADQANKLGASIKDLYAANTLYYQQGLNSQQAMSVGVETMKMARIANMDAAKATEAMTAALRGFNMEINETSAGRINDVYSELAAITASDTEQIATAMSKTASIAASANMEFETTAALLAQIIETTQEAPETAGTAMKTIIARFTEVKELFSQGMLTGEDGEGEEININKIDAALKTVGISLKDFLNGSKGIDDIFLELASKWNTLDLATQRYIATTAAGSRQQSRFIAMMSNYDRTMELVTAANNSAGASQKQFDKTLESLDAKLQRLSNAWDTFVMGLADNDIIKFGVDLLTKLLETVNNLTDDLGSTAGSIAKLGVAIAALKTGKNLFNSIFDITPLKQKLSEATGITGTFAQTLTKMGVKIKTETEGKINAASASINKFTGGLMAAGVACGALVQYLRSMGMEDFAKGLEVAGGALIAVASGLNLVNSIAVAAGTTVPALLGSIATAIAPALPVILGVAAAVGALVYILKKVYDRSAAGRLKAAQKDTQKAAEAAKEAAEEYNNLNTAISNIEDKTNALSELTKGTQEWRDAVIALNTEILDLVNTYPELASLLDNDGGILKIDYNKTAVNKRGEEYTAQDVLNSYLRKQTEAQQIYNQKQIREKQAETELQFTKTVKDFVGNLSILDLEKAEKESATGSAWNDAREIVDKLAIEIAKGNISIDKDSLQEWFNKNNLEMRDYEEFDYSVFKTYGDYLLSQQEAINGLTDATIAAHMAMLKLSNVSDEATEAVTNFDENILRDAYNAQLNDAKNREITENDYFDYADWKGYTYKKEAKWAGHGGATKQEMVYRDEEGYTVNIKESDVRDFIVNRATNEDFAGVLQKMAEHYDNADEREQELFTEIFAEGIQELSRTTLNKYATFQNGQFGFNQDNKDEFAKAMNFENFDDMVKTLEIGEDQLIAQLEEIFAIGGAEFVKARRSLIKNMSKYSSIGEKSYEENANILAGLEEKFGDQIRFTLENVISSLQLTGDEPLTSAGFDYFKKVAQTGTQEDVDNLSKFIESIDWTDPINGAYKLNQAVLKGSEITKGFAETILSVDDGFLSSASQFESFFNSDVYKDMGEDLHELLETQGEITEANVRGLASEYSYLNKLLKNTSATAEGLATILTSIEEGELTFEGITDAVIAAIGSMDTLGEATSEVIAKLEKLEFGDDLGKVQDFYSDWGEKLTEIQQEGGFGGPELTNFLDYVYGSEWDKGLVGDEAIIARENELIKRYQKILGKDMYYAWESAAKGLNIFGQEVDNSVLAKLDEAKIKLDYVNGEIAFEVPDDMTFDQVTEKLQEVFGGSKQLWDDLMTYFSYRSPELQRTWQLADYNQMGQRIAESETNIVEGKKFVTSQEVQTIAAEASVKYNDKDIQTIESELTKQLGQNEVEILTVLDTDDITTQANDLLTQLNTIFGGTDAFAGLFTSIENGISSLDFTALTQAVNSLPISEELAVQISNSIAQSIADAGGQITYEIEGETRTLDLDLMADGTNFIDAVNAEIAAAEEAAEQAELDSTATVTIDQAAWETSVDSAKTYIGNVLSGLRYPVKAYVSEVDTSVVTNSNPSGPSTGSQDWYLTYAAEGDPGVTRERDSLVGEEGPELIETADGAYLSGVGGPQVTRLHRGDVVHTAEETKEIFKRKGIPIPAYKGGTLKPAQTSGKSSDNDEDTWENPFDKLYNLVRKIDEELRQRERIERRYEKLLDSIDASASKIVSVSREELAQLEKERMLQEVLIAGRKSQISQYQSEKADLSAYANVVQNERGEDVLRINWNLIDQVTDPDEGARIEEYVSQMEEWFESLEEAEDALWDIEDAVAEIKERGEEEYFELEDMIKEAIVQSYQDEIDKLSEINNSINDTNASLLDAIQNSIDKQRQDRDNQRTEDDLAEKQRRLLYLQQDTSSANAMEILRLQEEIAQGQEDYTDTLIDQKISELQEQNDKAAEQRNQQITLAQTQLDHYIKTGRVWQEVYGLMEDGLDKDSGLVRGSRLEELLKSAEGFKGMSEISKMEWMNDTNNMIAQALAHLELGRQLEDIGTQAGSQIDFTTADGRVLKGTVNKDGSVTASDGKTYNNVFQGADGKYYAGENIKEVDQPKVEGPSTGQEGGGSKPENYPYGKASETSGNIGLNASGDQVRAIQYALNKLGYENQGTSSLDGKYGSYTKQAVAKFQSDNGAVADGIVGSETRAKFKLKGYKTGGLADFTGPAWLDGSKARPELVLNAKDTQNFIQLKDILSSLLNGSINTSTENNGDITYDIDINVESIGNDYDVEQVANKVKSLINDDARYRNNNAVSLKR